MESWSFILLGFGAAVAAVVFVSAVRAKRTADQILRRYQSMLRESRDSRAPSANDGSP